MIAKPSHWLALATAVAGGAVACALYVVRHGEEQRATRVNAAQDRQLMASRKTASALERAGRTGARPRQGPERRAGEPLPHRELEPRKVFGSPAVGGGAVVSEAQWLAHAATVEREANRELSRLVGLLDLDSIQQDQVFGVLARRSSSWMPGMQTSPDPLVGGGSSEADDVMAYLSYDQQQTLLEEEMDRQAWWEEVLPQLLPPQLQDGTGDGGSSGGTPGATDPAPDIKPFEGDGMLLEE